MAASLPTSKELQDAVASGKDTEIRKMLITLLSLATGNKSDLGEKASQILVDSWKECAGLEDDLVDALWFHGSALTSAKEESKMDDQGAVSSPAVDALIELIKKLVEVSDRQSFRAKLQSNLLPSLLDSAGLASEEELLKRLRIHNTQVNYKQQKYNLLQEETEGYSKLLHFVSSLKGDYEDNQLQKLRRLIGTFELDPNRVMDLMIDVLESKLFPQGSDKDLEASGEANSLLRLESKIFPQGSDKDLEASGEANSLLRLLRQMPIERLPSLLGFKLGSHAGVTPGLLRTIALLVTEEIVDFPTLFKEHWTPLESEIEEAHKILWMKEKRRIQALTRISLSGATKEDPKLTELKEQLQKAVIPLSSSPLINIVLIILRWSKWDIVKSLLHPEIWGKLCSLLPERFGFAFCDLAQEKLHSFYQARVGAPGLSKPWQTNEETSSVSSSDETSIDDVVNAVSEFLFFTINAGCIKFRPVLYCQLCRVFRSILEQSGTEEPPTDAAYAFFQKFMIPSLSLFGANPAVSTEVWSFLKLLPYATRYRLYKDWKGVGLERQGLGSTPSSGKPVPVVESEINAGKAARYSLKRLSKDNIRDMSRSLAKATHASPLVVYGTILNQIESYDNMVEVMVEAQRFSNPLGLDVLGFCILSRLSGTSGGVNRNRLKEDGVNVSQWLQSLEAFAGAFYRRYPFVEFRGVLAYLMRRLRVGHVMELGILSSLLKVAGGYAFADYSPAASLSVTQLEGRAGSFSLRRETMSFGIVETMNLTATETIKKVLQSDGFGVSMLVLIAQARSRIIFENSRGSPKPVKLVGNLYDSCQVVIFVLLEFLTSDETQDTENGAAIQEYAKHLPALDDLHFKYGLDVESSWLLTRPLARSVVQSKGSDEAPDPTLLLTETHSFRKKYENLLPEDAWSHLSPTLFESFYTNSLYDLFFPEEVYSAEIHRVSKEIERLERSKTSTGPGGPSKDDDRELGRLNTVLELLTSDKEKQQQQVDNVKEELEAKKDDLMNSDVISQDASEALLLHCVYPRSLQSPDDAMFCAHFAMQLHQIETPGFSTLHYLDELISVVAGSLFGITEGEAANLAILLWQTWSTLGRWRYDEESFETEVSGKPGAYMESPRTLGEEETNSPGSREISHKGFIDLYNSWHAILGKSLIGCLESTEYMHMRTGLVVLSRLVEVFPTRPGLGNKFFATLEPLQDENSNRPDIRAAANAYCTMLTKARAEGKWKEEDASVAQERAEKEQAAAEERKKKLEEQFEELQRDSEKITEEIGPRDTFERRRDGRRSQPHPDWGRGDGPGRESRDSRDCRSPPRDADRRRLPDAERGPPTRGADRHPERGAHRGGGERVGRNDERDRAVDHRIVRNDERDRGDRSGRIDIRDRGGRNDERDRGGRWVRGENIPPPPSENERNRGGKRVRGPSPEPGADDRGSVKRPRMDPETSRGPSPPPNRGRNRGKDSSRQSRPRRNR